MSLLTGLTNYWPMDNNTDVVGGITASDTTMTYPAGFIGNGALFDATTDQILTNNSSMFAGTADFTVSFWIKVTSTGQDRIMSQRNAYPGNWQIIHNADGTIAFYAKNGVATAIEALSTGTVSSSAYSHVVIIRKNTTTWSIYINNVEGHTTNGADSIGTGDTFTFGMPVGGLTSFIGNLDEVGIWNLALGVADVASLYAGGAGFAWPFTVTPTPTVTTGAGSGWKDSEGDDFRPIFQDGKPIFNRDNRRQSKRPGLGRLNKGRIAG